MTNHYTTLGVQKDATADEIKKAYRKLAGQHHPDKGGDKAKFQAIQAAYAVLGDPQKRAEYDHGSNAGFNASFNGQPFNFESIFDIFGARFHNGQQRRQQVRVSLWVSLIDIVQGGKKTISIGTQHGTQAVEIEIPKGINDGDNVQYGGIAPGGGDLIVQFRIHPNPLWQRQGQNLVTEMSVSIWDCILGKNMPIRDILGTELTVTVPANTQPGTILRLRHRGIPQQNGPAGDILVVVKATIPANIDPELLALIEQKRHQ